MIVQTQLLTSVSKVNGSLDQNCVRASHRQTS